MSSPACVTYLQRSTSMSTQRVEDAGTMPGPPACDSTKQMVSSYAPSVMPGVQYSVAVADTRVAVSVALMRFSEAIGGESVWPTVRGNCEVRTMLS